MVANFKTYESQARLLAAVIAAHPGLKLDYKAIADHFGSDMTVDAAQHRFRPVKKQAKVLQDLVKSKQDTKGVNILDKDEIAKYFGESTPDGIQFQFRSIKKEAETLKSAANNGQDTVQAWAARNGSIPATPRKRNPKSASTATTPASRGTNTRTPSGSKRKAPRPSYKEDSKESSSASVDYDELDVTPSQLKKKVKTTPNKTGIARRDSSATATPTASATAPTTAFTPIPAPAAAPAAAMSGPSTALAGSRTSPESDFSTVQTPVQPTVDPLDLQDTSKADPTHFLHSRFTGPALSSQEDSALGSTEPYPYSSEPYPSEFSGSFSFNTEFLDEGEI